MKVSELIECLAALQDEYGDLDCVVYPLSGIEPVRRPGTKVLQDFDFGHLGSRRTGDRIIVLWSKV